MDSVRQTWTVCVSCAQCASVVPNVRQSCTIQSGTVCISHVQSASVVENMHQLCTECIGHGEYASVMYRVHRSWRICISYVQSASVMENMHQLCTECKFNVVLRECVRHHKTSLVQLY